MVEQNETENLKFLCYYHIIISTMSTSLISLDSFFVTDSDRRKSVIELEKIKNYYEKSLLLENQIKGSNVIIDTKKFEDRMKINYEFNNIINEFWGYNEIKKYYEHNQLIKDKIKHDMYLQQRSNSEYYDNYEENFMDKSLSDLAVYNSLEFININNDELSNDNNFDEQFNNENSKYYLNENNNNNNKYFKLNPISNNYTKNILSNSSKKNKHIEKKHLTRSNNSLLNDKISKPNKNDKKNINNKSPVKTKLKTKSSKKQASIFDHNIINDLSKKYIINKTNNFNKKHIEISNNHINQEKKATSSKFKIKNLNSTTTNSSIFEYRPLNNCTHNLFKKSTNSLSSVNYITNIKVKSTKKENGHTLRK